jgi:periplasmic protein TonB
MAFEGVLLGARRGPSRARRLTVTLSLLLHAAALAVGVAYSFWRVDELPLPAVTVTLTGTATPPPPPPPPAGVKASTKPKTKPVETRPKELVQPKEVKAAPKEEPEDDGGQPGGVAGGVKGGVVGGVVGAAVGPTMLPAKIGQLQLLINPNNDPYKVSLPPALLRSGRTFTADLRVCVSAQGTVTEVRILRRADPAIDVQIPTVIGRWRYRPYTVNGVPAPFCYIFRYLIE